MKLHRNARTTPISRSILVRRILKAGWRVSQAAAAAGISRQTARKWVLRYRAHGAVGLEERPDPLPLQVSPDHPGQGGGKPEVARHGGEDDGVSTGVPQRRLPAGEPKLIGQDRSDAEEGGVREPSSHTDLVQ